MKGNARLPVRVAYAALAWVVVFFALHIYWYLGGSFASPGKLPDLFHHSLVGWTLEVLVDSAWPLGAWVCLAIARGWPQGGMRRAALIVVWLGCAVLVLRGATGLIDDLTRATRLLPNGITGLSTKQTTGMAHLTWSGWAIDAYFFAGGLLFGLLAHHYRPPRSARFGVAHEEVVDADQRPARPRRAAGTGPDRARHAAPPARAHPGEQPTRARHRADLDDGTQRNARPAASPPHDHFSS